MGRVPVSPDPVILAEFIDPVSLTKVWKRNKWVRERIWAHMKAARRLGLICQVGTFEDWGPPQLLYELTPEGLKWLEENKL